MKITLRLIVSIIVSVALVAGVFTYLTVRTEKKRLAAELEHRTWLVSEGLKGSIGSLIPGAPSKKMDAILEKISTSKRILGIAVYDTSGRSVSVTSELSDKPYPRPDIIFEEFKDDDARGLYSKVSSATAYLYALPVHDDKGLRTGTVVVFADASYIDDYISGIWRRNFLRALANALIISIVIVIVIRWSITGPIARMLEWVKNLHRGKSADDAIMPKEDIFIPISREISSLARSLAVARASAEEEARLRRSSESTWNAERLKVHVHDILGNRKLIVVSNREPYMHVRNGKVIECISPASGVITAVDPMLKACGGLWVAHGSGNADREVSDPRGIVRVPPDNPQYELKRIWLSREEEEGYYYGFSNEGIWPLCHIAHMRPVFRVEDWNRYQEVNTKFAAAVEDELDENSFVLVQDYHFAILPRIIKERRPSVKIALFWHIPWPNPEVFGICPWKREIIHGMLGADLIGFHTQFHCNNFLETVDRTLECNTNWERFSTTRMGRTTFVKPFPISVDPSARHASSSMMPSREDLMDNLGIKASRFGIGVDRLDYIKGIVERFRAVERFLEKYPAYRGEFTFVQIGAPSREHIKQYHDFHKEVASEADRINWRFGHDGWSPIVFLEKHFSHDEIEPYYRNADLCMVTSLHDGMNLVAKEFVSSREDEDGVLILSTFTGASLELLDALLVNPYNIEQMADMIRTALEMAPEDKRLRMRRMRSTVKEYNIYKWAGDIVTELSKIRNEQTGLR